MASTDVIDCNIEENEYVQGVKRYTTSLKKDVGGEK